MVADRAQPIGSDHETIEIGAVNERRERGLVGVRERMRESRASSR